VIYVAVWFSGAILALYVMFKCCLQYTKRDRVTGVDTVIYSVVSRHQMTVDGVVDVIVVNVRLNCVLKATPWCLTPRQLTSVMAEQRKRLIPEEFARLEESLSQHGIVYDRSRT